MNIYRFLTRIIFLSFYTFVFRGVKIKGKGILRNVKCENRGKENCIQVDAGASLSKCSFYFKGNYNKLHIKCGTHLNGVRFCFEDDNNTIDIGGMVTCESGLLFAACESKSIIIGDDCMFSNNIQLRTTDSHSILDSTGIRLNHGKNICIGNHVWIGTDSMILKGSYIPDGCVIGSRSVITSSLKMPSNSIVAGIPAKVIRTSICWKRERI